MSWPPGAAPDYIHDETLTTLKAAADSKAGSTVPDSAGYIHVSAITTDANDWITLPPIKTGRMIHGYSAVAHGIRTPASSGTKINDVVSDGTATAGITATYSWVARATPAGWVLTVATKLGAAGTTVVPA